MRCLFFANSIYREQQRASEVTGPSIRTLSSKGYYLLVVTESKREKSLPVKGPSVRECLSLPSIFLNGRTKRRMSV
jgi:hypothetical protein